MRPSTRDLIALGAFLLIAGGVTIGLGLAVARFGLPRWIRSMRGRFILVSALVTILALANIAFVSVLMFLSTHDLILLGGLLAFSLGLSFFVALILAQATTSHLRVLSGAAHDISVGNLSVRVPVASTDEIGELANAFNAMAERLQVSLERERSLEKSRRKLIEAVSHDLRTPLASIRAMVESINDGVVTDDATIERYLLTMQAETQNLSQLIDDLFELSQIDAGELKLHLDRYSIERLVAETMDTMAARAASQSISLEQQVDRTLTPVTMDYRRMQRVLSNLLQNSMQHTPPRGSVCVRALDREAMVELQVADTGEGIPAKDLRKIFEPSDQPVRSGSRQPGGTGLGLRIAKGIIEAHGGRIWVESQPGRGSVFSFTLPKGIAAHPA
jgi:signal transduction histidine kinase